MMVGSITEMVISHLFMGFGVLSIKNKVLEALINSLGGMKRKAHVAQEPKHICTYVEVTSTAQRSDSPAQAINQRWG